MRLPGEDTVKGFGLVVDGSVRYYDLNMQGAAGIAEVFAGGSNNYAFCK